MSWLIESSTNISEQGATAFSSLRIQEVVDDEDLFVGELALHFPECELCFLECAAVDEAEDVVELGFVLNLRIVPIQHSDALECGCAARVI